MLSIPLIRSWVMVGLALLVGGLWYFWPDWLAPLRCSDWRVTPGRLRRRGPARRWRSGRLRWRLRWRRRRRASGPPRTEAELLPPDQLAGPAGRRCWR